MLSDPQMQAKRRDEAIMDEFKRTRDLAVDAIATRAINLRIDLAACMAENEQLKAQIAALKKESGTGTSDPKEKKGGPSG